LAAASIPLNGTTSLTFYAFQHQANLTLNGVAFTDSLPRDWLWPRRVNLNSTCRARQRLSMDLLNQFERREPGSRGQACTVSVNVTGTTSRGEEQQRSSLRPPTAAPEILPTLRLGVARRSLSKHLDGEHAADGRLA